MLGLAGAPQEPVAPGLESELGSTYDALAGPGDTPMRYVGRRPLVACAMPPLRGLHGVLTS